MPVTSICETCEKVMIRDETHKNLLEYTGTHIYCMEIKMEVFGIIKLCTSYSEQITYDIM